ncbi:MAG TPA: LytTR family DNA-binding domain-containing protein [Bacteroidales bacterium]|nr:LytTR family DNA-binding domain-containing protein [Bacteroidales bacterium]HRX96124.1 LytTR family DNA-binding domain-containing protein [Bacteroidales bacterium]
MQKNLTALIVDDEEKARNLLENLVMEMSNIEIIAKASSVDQAFQMVLDLIPDIVFLDVEMPEKNGFELLKLLKNSIHSPFIVFITAYDKYAIEAFRYAAFDYLLKPVDKNDLHQTIVRILEQKVQIDFSQRVELFFARLDHKHRIKLNTREGYILIDPQEIIYCKADGSYTEIYLKTGVMEISTFNLGKIADHLTFPNFFRISRSVVINLDFLKEVNRKKKTCILMFNGKNILFEIPRNTIKNLTDI